MSSGPEVNEQAEHPDFHRAFSAVRASSGPAREAKHRLVAEVKRLVEAVAMAGAEASGSDALDALSTRVADAATMAESSLSRLPDGLAMAAGEDAALLERSGFSGRSNPLAPPLQFWTDEYGITHGAATYGPAYEGPPESLHGGYVAAAFDDLLGFAQMASGTAGFTGTLTVKMRRRTPLNRRIDYRAEVVRVDGRKIWVTGTATCDGVLLAEAEILFIKPRDHMPNELPPRA